MNLKTLIALIVAAAVAILVAFTVTKKDSASWKTVEAGGLIFEDMPVNDVDQINIARGEDSLTLMKQDGIWVVKERSNYPASFENISDLVLKLSELKPLRVVEAGKSQFSRLSLLPSSSEENGGTQLDVKNQSGKLVASLLLGKEFMRQSESQRNPMMGGGMPEGRYILVGGEAPVYLVAETFNNVNTDASSWLNRDFFKVEKLSSISVQFTGEAAPDWEFTRESATGDFKLTNAGANENVDPSKIRSLSSVFSYASFTDVMPGDTDPAETRLNAPTVAVLKTFDGFTYTINIGRLTGDESGRYLSMKVDADLPTERTAAADEKEEDKARLDKEFQANLERLQKKLAKEKEFENWVYIVSTWTVENLLKNRVNWMKEESANAPAAAQELPPAPPESEIPVMLERPEEDVPPAPPAPEVLDEIGEGDDVVVLEDELNPPPGEDGGDEEPLEPEPEE
ncbi:MAG: DUF4340 domain-containing protein [Verrucomicrobia bacterium]|nr:DUF4340 domain-containing protein [Verrucomicrobiota bacterium]MBP5759842.1 DUF4340 domain-containing protein [Verrucomicrobiota bacterium]